MIVTLTANPSLDRTVTLGSALVPGGVHRITSDTTDPGGKGINVALGVARAGLDVTAVLPALRGDPLLALLDAQGLPHVATDGGPVRTNITVLADGVTTKINEPGSPLSLAQVGAMRDALASTVTAGDLAMLSGSLAPGVPEDFYAQVIRVLRPLGVWIGVDTSDAPLAALAAAGPAAAPDFLKPNAEELGQLTGRDGAELEARATGGDLDVVRDAACALHTHGGVGEVLVTLGGAGAVLATAAGTWFSPSPDYPVVSTVGAGDSAVAGYLIARSASLTPPECLAMAVAYGAVAVSLPGTTIPRRSDVHPDPSTVRVL